MKITEFGSLQMVRTNEAHFGNSEIKSISAIGRTAAVNRLNSLGFANPEKNNVYGTSIPFRDFLEKAVNDMNAQQINVQDVQQKLITNPDDVDIHDVTIAMAKARSSLNLAQNVISRLIQSWSEITTTR